MQQDQQHHLSSSVFEREREKLFYIQYITKKKLFVRAALENKKNTNAQNHSRACRTRKSISIVARISRHRPKSCANRLRSRRALCSLQTTRRLGRLQMEKQQSLCAPLVSLIIRPRTAPSSTFPSLLKFYRQDSTPIDCTLAERKSRKPVTSLRAPRLRQTLQLVLYNGADKQPTV